MLTNQVCEVRAPHVEMPLLAAVALQDHLMTATNDLERLQRLLDDACDTLIEGFQGAAKQLSEVIDQGGAEQILNRTVTALQFQDLATQLISHTNRRLRNCADQIARDAMGDDADGEAVFDERPLKLNPVIQDDMGAGSVELF